MKDIPKLPLSLKQKRAKQITVRIIIWLIFLLLFIFIIINWGNKLFPQTLKSRTGYAGLQIMFYILLLLIPCIISGVPFKLIDKSWSGTITAVIIEENLKASKGGRPRLSKNHDLILMIKRDDGKEIEYTVLSDTALREKMHYHENKVLPGDRVYKYYGFKYLYITPQRHHTHKGCIVCGSKNAVTEKRCWHCKSELLFDYKNLYK